MRKEGQERPLRLGDFCKELVENTRIWMVVYIDTCWEKGYNICG